MNADLIQRIRRIYAAIGALEETDLSDLKAKVIETKQVREILQDFRGGLSNEDLSNAAHSVIYNIAHLRDHLKQWARQNGRDAQKVDEAIKHSLELRIIIDLSNNDKHGYPPRNGGSSGKAPQLVRLNRIMRLTTRPQKGSTIDIRLGSSGVPESFGDGKAAAIITGDVVDKDNNAIGDLCRIAARAVKAWEKLLSEFNLCT